MSDSEVEIFNYRAKIVVNDILDVFKYQRLIEEAVALNKLNGFIKDKFRIESKIEGDLMFFTFFFSHKDLGRGNQRLIYSLMHTDVLKFEPSGFLRIWKIEEE